MSEKINDKIKELMEKENLDPAEMEAETQKINEAILDVWADSSKHVKTLASLPPEVFDLVIENMANIRQCLNENDTDRPGFADNIPQDVVIGHMVIEGINSLFEKHTHREMRKHREAMEEAKRAAARAMRKKLAEAFREEGFDLIGGPAGMGGLGGAIAAAMAAVGAERVKPDEKQIDAMEQFIRSKFGPDAKIERTADGFDVSVPSEQAPDPKDVIAGIKDIFGTEPVFVEKTEGEEEDRQDSPAEGCNGDCESCSKNPFKELMQTAAPEKGNGDIIVADDDHGVIILSNEDAPKTATESLN